MKSDSAESIIESGKDANSTRAPKRNRHIDISRGIGILLVVLGHNEMISGESWNIIFSFHMPLFFFLSGIFFTPDRSISATLFGRMDSLLKPFFVTLVFLGVLLALFRDINFYQYLSGVLYGTGSTLYWEQMWFLPHLFVVSVFSWYLQYLFEKVHAPRYLRFASIVFLLLVGVHGADLFWNYKIEFMDRQFILPGLPFSVDIILVTSFYFLLGNLTNTIIRNFAPSPIVLFLLSILFVVLHYFFDQTIDFNLRRYDSFIISTAEALSGIYIILAFSYYIKFYSTLAACLSYIGSASIFILMFNGFIQGHSFSLFAKFLGDETIMVDILAFGAASFVPVLLWTMVKRNDISAFFFFPLARNILFQRLKRRFGP